MGDLLAEVDQDPHALYELEAVERARLDEHLEGDDGGAELAEAAHEREARRERAEAPPELAERLAEPLHEVGVHRRAGRPGARHVAEVDLARGRVLGVARVRDLLHVLGDEDPRHLDPLVRAGRLGLDIDAAGLEDPAVALELGVRLVDDEVGRLVHVLHVHEDVPRHLRDVLRRVDRDDLGVPEEDVVPLAVDRVARHHLDGEVAPLAREDAELPREARNDAAAMADLVVEPPLVDVVPLAGLEVLALEPETVEVVQPEVSLDRFVSHVGVPSLGCL